jgi:hypothetical protein
MAENLTVFIMRCVMINFEVSHTTRQININGGLYRFIFHSGIPCSGIDII